MYFPDLPGCTSAGRTMQEAALNAEEALAGHRLETARAGEAPADPSDLDAIARDPPFVIPADARMGSGHLPVSQTGRSEVSWCLEHTKFAERSAVL